MDWKFIGVWSLIIAADLAVWAVAVYFILKVV